MNTNDDNNQNSCTTLQSKPAGLESKLEWQQPELISIDMRETRSGTPSTNPTMEGTFYTPASS